MVSAARDIWRQSEIYQECKKSAKDPKRVGWYICKRCRKSREVIRIDHVNAIGKQPDCWEEFGIWFTRLFCPLSNLQPLDTDCHREKGTEDKLKAKHLAKN